MNGALNSRGELFGIGVVTLHFWVLMNARIGIDFEWNPETAGAAQLGDWGLDIDMEQLAITIESQNAHMQIRLTDSGLVNIRVDITKR